MRSVDIAFGLFALLSQENAVYLESAVQYLKEKSPGVKEVEVFSTLNHAVQKGYICIKDGVITYGGEETAKPDFKKIGLYVRDILTGRSLSRADIILRLCRDYGHVCDGSMRKLVQEHLRQGTESAYYKMAKSKFSINDRHELRTHSFKCATPGSKKTQNCKARVRSKVLVKKMVRNQGKIKKRSVVKVTRKKNLTNRRTSHSRVSSNKRHLKARNGKKSERLKKKVVIKKRTAKIACKKLGKELKGKIKKRSVVKVTRKKNLTNRRTSHSRVSTNKRHLKARNGKKSERLKKKVVIKKRTAKIACKKLGKELKGKKIRKM